jgi:N-acetylglucosaminyl-diphospho-decaprenol L-rhamnosyltransferase
MKDASLFNLTIASTVHNNVDMSRKMLQSFLTLVGIPAEIVLVDDASFPLVKESDYGFPVRILRNDQAAGFCNASDRALREVRTDFALLVDADVLFLEGDFAGGLAAFCEEKTAAWCVFREIDSGGRPQSSFATRIPPALLFGLGNQATALWEHIAVPEARPTIRGRLAPVTVAHSSCTMVNMTAFRAIGGFDPWYWQCESDLDLSLRFTQRGYMVAADLGYTVCHEGAGGKTGGTKRTLDLYRARLHLYEKFHPTSRIYLRMLLWFRHLFETLYFIFSKRLLGRDCAAQQALRIVMLRTVFHGYNERN